MNDEDINSILEIAGFIYSGELGTSDGRTIHKWIYNQKYKNHNWLNVFNNEYSPWTGIKENNYIQCNVYSDIEDIKIQNILVDLENFKKIFAEEFIKNRDKKIKSILKK